MKITIFGFYDNKNIGDEAYKLAFPLMLPNHELNFVNNITTEPECLIVGGGDILNPSFMNKIKHIKNKFAMSVNVFGDEYTSQFKHVISRNKDYKNYLPDFAFMLTPNPDNGKRLIEKLSMELYSKVVVVVMNAFLDRGNAKLTRDTLTFQKVCQDLASIADNTCASFIFLPFGNGFPYNDRIANSVVYNRCKYWKKNALVFDELSVQDTLDICAAADAVISTRLHANIFACIGGTPFIDLTHHNKTGSFMRDLEKDWSVNYWSFNKDKVQSLLLEFLQGHRDVETPRRYKEMLESSHKEIASLFCNNHY